MAYSTPLAAVSEAIYGVMQQDSTLVSLAPGGVFTDVPQDPSYPFLWIEVREPRQWGGFGTKPGLGTLPEIEIWLHAFSQFQGWAEAQSLMSRAIALIADPPTVTGYASCGIFHDATIPLPDQELNGEKVHELVSQHRLYVQEQ